MRYTMADLKPGLLARMGNRLLKISTVDENGFTAELVLPVGPRTSVTRYASSWASWLEEPGALMLERYHQAYGKEV